MTPQRPDTRRAEHWSESRDTSSDMPYPEFAPPGTPTVVEPNPHTAPHESHAAYPAPHPASAPPFGPGGDLSGGSGGGDESWLAAVGRIPLGTWVAIAGAVMLAGAGISFLAAAWDTLDSWAQYGVAAGATVAATAATWWADRSGRQILARIASVLSAIGMTVITVWSYSISGVRSDLVLGGAFAVLAAVSVALMRSIRSAVAYPALVGLATPLATCCAAMYLTNADHDTIFATGQTPGIDEWVYSLSAAIVAAAVLPLFVSHPTTRRVALGWQFLAGVSLIVAAPSQVLLNIVGSEDPWKVSLPAVAAAVALGVAAGTSRRGRASTATAAMAGALAVSGLAGCNLLNGTLSAAIGAGSATVIVLAAIAAKHVRRLRAGALGAACVGIVLSTSLEFCAALTVLRACFFGTFTRFFDEMIGEEVVVDVIGTQGDSPLLLAAAFLAVLGLSWALVVLRGAPPMVTAGAWASSAAAVSGLAWVASDRPIVVASLLAASAGVMGVGARIMKRHSPRRINLHTGCVVSLGLVASGVVISWGNHGIYVAVTAVAIVALASWMPVTPFARLVAVWATVLLVPITAGQLSMDWGAGAHHGVLLCAAALSVLMGVARFTGMTWPHRWEVAYSRHLCIALAAVTTGIVVRDVTTGRHGGLSAVCLAAVTGVAVDILTDRRLSSAQRSVAALALPTLSALLGYQVLALVTSPGMSVASWLVSVWLVVAVLAAVARSVDTDGALRVKAVSVHCAAALAVAGIAAYAGTVVVGWPHVATLAAALALVGWAPRQHATATPTTASLLRVGSVIAAAGGVVWAAGGESDARYVFDAPGDAFTIALAFLIVGCGWAGRHVIARRGGTVAGYGPTVAIATMLVCVPTAALGVTGAAWRLVLVLGLVVAVSTGAVVFRRRLARVPSSWVTGAVTVSLVIIGCVYLRVAIDQTDYAAWVAGTMVATAAVLGAMWGVGPDAGDVREKLAAITVVVPTLGLVISSSWTLTSKPTTWALAVAWLIVAAAVVVACWVFQSSWRRLVTGAAVVVSFVHGTLMFVAQPNGWPGEVSAVVVALVLLGPGYLAVRQGAPSVFALGVQCLLLVLPSAVLAVAAPGSDGAVWRLWFVPLASAGLLAAGAFYRLLAPVIAGGVGLMAVLVMTVVPWWQGGTPPWLALALGGLVLLVVGTRLEDMRKLGRGLRALR